MSLFSRHMGWDAARERKQGKQDWWGARGGDPNGRFDQAIVDEGNGGGWIDAFNKSAGSFLENQMPAFRNSLQLTREDAIRRGASTGDLGTSYEGDLASAFQRNIANALGGLSMQGYENNRNRYLDLLSGRLDMNTAGNNARNQMWGSAMQTGASLIPFAF